MALSNLNNQHLSQEQITALNEALASLEEALKPLNINLTPEDRNKYGRVNEQNKLFINKVNDIAVSQPSLRSIDVDWEEFFKDYKSRGVYETAINRLEALLDRLKNAKILHDYDNYQDALNDYQYTVFRASTNAVGYETKKRELSQFFTKSRKKSEENPTAEPKE